MAVSIAINAGGKSSRMGTNKAFVEIAGRPLIEHIIDKLNRLAPPELFLITNEPDSYAHLGLTMYGDVMPDKGSLGGIYSAIYHSHSHHTLVVACDMPFLNPELLRYLISLAGDNVDVVVPRVDQYPQGLHAVYSKNCLQPIKARLEADHLKVIGFYGDVQVRYVDEHEYELFGDAARSFFNINTPEDLLEARRLLER